VTVTEIILQRDKARQTESNSNKSPTRCNSFPVYYPDVYLQLNNVSDVFPPIIRSSTTAVAASGYITGLTTNTA
jgi:hypothetical protein